jgi:hypothetical protein
MTIKTINSSIHYIGQTILRTLLRVSATIFPNNCLIIIEPQYKVIERWRKSGK